MHIDIRKNNKMTTSKRTTPVILEMLSEGRNRATPDAPFDSARHISGVYEIFQEGQGTSFRKLYKELLEILTEDGIPRTPVEDEEVLKQLVEMRRAYTNQTKRR